MGCVSSLGMDCIELEQALFAKECASDPTEISLFTSKKVVTKVAAEVKNYAPASHFSALELKQLDRYSQFALIATAEAIKLAKLGDLYSFGTRAAVVYGSGVGGQTTIEESYKQLHLEGKSRVHPFTVPKLIPCAAASQISMKYGITGPAFATTSACASAGHAIAMAAMMIRSNLIDIAIVGGAEACITEGNFLAWEGLRVLSPDLCRPFSKGRSGLIIGEGAGTLILESEQHCLSRGAQGIAELSGIGMSSDAHNLVQPHVNGATSSMQACLEDAKMSPEDIQYINAHGSGTKQNDLTETQAIHRVFGEHARRLSVSSTKSQHGHVLGAGAAIEAIATILALTKQTLPATRHYLGPDPACDLDYVINCPRPASVTAALSNSFAFGGLNTSLAFNGLI
tara:strand:+ start:18434 stop:19627 length:1194 start_codon:yes stop_codon:yes gene_type:complete